MTTITQDSTHIWEAKGLGRAPFKLLTVISLPSPTLAEKNPLGFQNAMVEVSQSCRSLGVHCGTCDVCGTGIMNNFVIESKDKRRFVVGCDCVMKTGDAGLIRETDRVAKLKARQKRAEARKAKLDADWEANRPEREARQAEWARREEERKIREAAAAESNRWLLDVLEGIPIGGGGFIDSMIETLRREPLSGLSDRCQGILASIYAKTKGRSGSKAYAAAEAEFWTKAGA